ncbi:MAG: cytochrome c biogenesis protein CcsA [Gemmatimonadota bacterium]|nr:cytochrome c biogenesis protein CcsA [Gemmatimonadota bacterium]
MDRLLSAVNVLLPLAYLAVWLDYRVIFQHEARVAIRWSRRLALGTLALHTVAVVVRAVAWGRLPMATPLEFLSMLAFAVLAIYVVLEIRIGAPQTGFHVVGLAFAFQLLSSAFLSPETADHALLQDPGFALHAILVLLAYTALSLGFIYALLYLLQARQLVRRTFGLLFQRLPSLEILERMSVRSIQMGVPLLFGALVTGHWWTTALAGRLGPEAASRLSHFDPKVVVSWLFFLMYGVGLWGYERRGWRGRRMSILSVALFVLMVLAVGIVRHFFRSFHNFNGGGAG